MSARGDDQKSESPLFGLAVMAFAFVMLGLLVWLVASQRIVYGSLKPSLWLGSVWKWLPGDYGVRQWNALVTTTQVFMANPAKVSFFDWASYFGSAIRPAVALLMTLYLCLFLLVKRRFHTRRFTAKSLLEHTMRHFSGVAPVVAIRRKIAKDEHPLWRRQVTPEEVFLNYRVPRSGKANPMTLAPAGAPMVRDGQFDREVARAYFTAVQHVSEDGRLVSGMLGRQVVNLAVDGRLKHAHKVCYADRMSSEGKALLALWAAVAFGGKSGRDEYAKYRDLLNYSAYGTKDGMANLTVVQPLYNKYRLHPTVGKLFAVHHWEHTALFALLGLAQKKGRFTTAEVLWLRPTNRVMFFALNSRGSFTPHTEAAATFTQVAFESGCARLGRLPVRWMPDGRLVHVLYVDKAIEGLELEWKRWAEGIDDVDDDWWTRADLWTRTNATIEGSFKQLGDAVPTAPMPGETDASRKFDEVMSAGAGAAPEAETAFSPVQVAPDLNTLFAMSSAAAGSGDEPF